MNKAAYAIICSLIVLGFPFLCPSVESTNPFTKIASIRALSPEEAAEGLPVEVRAIVTYFNELLQGDLVIQDETAGIYIMPLGKLLRAKLRPGDIISLKGRTGAGEFAPTLVADEIRVLGRTNCPMARLVTFDQLASGAEDSQRVEIKGTVRSVTIEKQLTPPRLLMDVATGQGRVTARVLETNPESAQSLVDARVTIRGVCVHLFTRKRQLFNVRLLVSSLNDVIIEKPAPEDPFSIPLRKIDKLLRFTPHEPSGHRVKVRGVVTAAHSSDSFYLRDDTQGLRVETKQKMELMIGDQAEVVGFPGMGEYNPVLHDATFRKIGTGSLPVPIRIKADQAFDHDSELVEMEATLLDKMHRGDEQVLVLQADNFVFNGHLATAKGEDQIDSIRVGSRIRLHGICAVRVGQGERRYMEEKKPESFKLLLRSPLDLHVLQQASWWTAGRMLGTVAVLTALFSVVLFAVIANSKEKARNLSRKQAASEAQFAAVLAERTRMAREIHDTLEQGMTGIMLQLDVAIAKFTAATPQTLLRYLETAREMVRYSRSDIRRSVWDLRSPVLEQGNLLEAFQEMSRQFSKPGTEAEIHSTGLVNRLPGAIENQLLRIGQEAFTNATKHANATRIEISLHFTERSVELRVRDNGGGFPEEGRSAAGHFGLQGMRERANKIGARFSMESAPGKGTLVLVVAPLDDAISAEHATPNPFVSSRAHDEI